MSHISISKNSLVAPNNDFRDRSQTAPSVIMKRLRARNNEETTALKENSRKNDKLEPNNNTEGERTTFSRRRYILKFLDSQDDVGAIEMPKQNHNNETKKQQKHRFPFKKNREKVGPICLPLVSDITVPYHF